MASSVTSIADPLLEMDDPDRFGGVLGRSPPMHALFRSLRSARRQRATVLLEGETGTGKELIARALHEESPRSKEPFIVVDCGAIPHTLIEAELFGHVRGAFTNAATDRAGAFEAAHGGTIFLDEIGELDLAMQPRLLRVLERGEVKRIGANHHVPVDVRVVAATNRDLSDEVDAGRFRADLYYRLAVLHLRVPPLRERPEDLELLAEHLLSEVARRNGVPRPTLSAETKHQLASRPWRGNVRELRNYLERMVLLSLVPEPASAPSRPPPQLADLEAIPFREAKARWTEYFDIEYLSRLLERCGHNVAEAARQSGIDRVHLFRLIKKYGLRAG